MTGLGELLFLSRVERAAANAALVSEVMRGKREVSLVVWDQK